METAGGRLSAFEAASLRIGSLAGELDPVLIAAVSLTKDDHGRELPSIRRAQGSR